MKVIFRKLLIVLVIFGIIEFAYVLIFPSKGAETFPVIHVTDETAVRIICPEKIIHYKENKMLDTELVNENTLEVRMQEPADSLAFLTVASENYFASWNIRYLPGKTPDEADAVIRMTDKNKTGKFWAYYKKLVTRLDSL